MICHLKTSLFELIATNLKSDSNTFTGKDFLISKLQKASSFADTHLDASEKSEINRILILLKQPIRLT